jgi:hypothetical protein
MTPNRLSPAGAQFTHNGQVWQISVTAWCGVWRVIIECEGRKVEQRVFVRSRPANKIVEQVILEKFGKEYGLC